MAVFIVSLPARRVFGGVQQIRKEQNMGLIKAAAGAAGGMMADQWKEFFVCDAIDDDVLVVKGSKQASGRS